MPNSIKNLKLLKAPVYSLNCFRAEVIAITFDTIGFDFVVEDKGFYSSLRDAEVLCNVAGAEEKFPLHQPDCFVAVVIAVALCLQRLNPIVVDEILHQSR